MDWRRWHFTLTNPAAFNMYRLQIDRVRDPAAADAVQIAEIELLGESDADLRPTPLFADAISAQGANPPVEAPTKAFDGWMEEAGGRNNAWTAEDRTDYFDIAPSTAMPLLLWLEADRMRDLGPLIDQAKLDLQRDLETFQARKRREVAARKREQSTSDEQTTQ